jgi:hypothetical protein
LIHFLKIFYIEKMQLDALLCDFLRNYELRLFGFSSLAQLSAHAMNVLALLPAGRRGRRQAARPPRPGALAWPSVPDFLSGYHLDQSSTLFMRAGYDSLAHFPCTELTASSTFLHIRPQMRPPEWRRLVRILVERRHLTPSVLATGVAGFRMAAARLAAARLDNNGCPVASDLVIADASALLAPAGVPVDTRSPTADPTGCKAPTVARKDRRAPDDGDAEPQTLAEGDADATSLLVQL